MDGQGDLFKPREFDDAGQQKKYAAHRIEAVAAYLKAQGIPPLFIAAALFETHKTYNRKGLDELAAPKE